MHKKIIIIILMLFSIINCDYAENETRSASTTPITLTPEPSPTVYTSPTITPLPITESIIIDHTCTDIEQIPDEWIDEVKKMMICIPGESHSKGYVYGLELLETENPVYAMNATWEGEPESYTDAHLRIGRTYRNLANDGWAVSAGEEDFWTSQEAIDMMDNNLSYCENTLHNTIHAFGFGWCWDMILGEISDGWSGRLYYPVDKSNETTPWDINSSEPCLQDYLNAFEFYNTSNPQTVTFYTTGPADQSGEIGYQGWLKHEAIRNWVNNSIEGYLFDYADILTWNADGEVIYLTWDGESFPRTHTDYSGEYDGGEGSCHVNESGCIKLGKAIWWMMARIAGWEGI